MHEHNLDKWGHLHRFAVDDIKGEKKTRVVVFITVITMIVEITSGYIYESMALLADGWHMGTHAGALGISLFAYVFARKYTDDNRFSFGTGKVGALGGFGSAIILAIAALLMAVESFQRISSPVTIQFNQAIIVAIIGLIVNLICALILQKRHDHSQNVAEHNDNHHDHNLRAAHLHIVADALTSLLAIIALLTGKFFRWTWMDPLMGIVGAVIIFRWAYYLLKNSGSMLLDAEVDQRIIKGIKEKIEAKEDNKVCDIHIWRVGPRHLAGIVSLVTRNPKPIGFYKNLIADYKQIVHLSIEVNSCESTI